MSHAEGQTQAFQADVARLLHLMVHSVYSERDVFLRELLSNAADACEKLRYEALADHGLVTDDSPYAIQITIDKDGGKLTVADNGIGMSRDELADALGTIARSGTKAFLDRLGSEGGDTAGAGTDLIGQFGIGFYSAFMVADRVDVETRRAGSGEAFTWSSDGKGTFSIAPLAPDVAPVRGTRVLLHLNEEAAKEFLDPYRIERIVQERSNALAIPIDLVESPGSAPRRLSEGAALWSRPKSAITAEEYTAFYRGLGQFDEPALTLHWRAEGRHEYTVLAFVPSSRPFNLFDPARKGRAKLYVRKVLISQDAEVLPGWLRFVRLVVDSADLPLNVSREMIQESALFGAIKKGVTNRVMQELTKLADSDPAAYGKVWENFGSVLKEGLYEDPERRDGLFKLARFATSTESDGKRSLADYVASLRENQTAIYYLVGDDLKRLAASPQLEGFRSRGIEVLLLPDPVDAFWVSTAVGFEGKPFKSVTQGAADIKPIPLKEGGTEAPADPPSASLATLYALMKQELAEIVEDVRASDRLSESPACLVAPDKGMDRRLEQMLAAHGQVGATSKPILEVNPSHPLIAALAAQADSADKSAFHDIVWLLFDEARVMEGEKPADASNFAARLTRVLVKAAGQPPA